MARQPKWYDTNPLMDWLRGQGLTIKELSLLAGTDYIAAYMAVSAWNRRIPARFRNVIDRRSGSGASDLIDAAYVAWRNEIAGDIGKGVTRA